MKDKIVISITETTFSNGSKTAVTCPFHEEKTPSLLIDIKSKTYHCLGCGKKGKITGSIILSEPTE